jgi:hypothetical protein
MRTIDKRAGPFARAEVPLLWAVPALLAAGVIFAVFQHDAAPWLLALGGATATFIAVVAFASSMVGATTTEAVVQHVQDGWATVRTELARSRRHDRRFAIVGIPEAVWSPPSAEPPAKAQLGLDIAESVQAQVRRPDRAWVDDAMLHLLLTDCDQTQGRAFLERARAVMPQVFADDRVNLVIFPDDGITLGALVAALREGNPGSAREPVTE